MRLVRLSLAALSVRALWLCQLSPSRRSLRGRFVSDAAPEMGPFAFGSKISVRLSRRGDSMPSLMHPVRPRSQCCGVTRAGRRCTIRSDCNMTDSSGRAVAEPLRRGSTHCIFHATHFCSTPAAATDALLFYLDLETTGLNIGSDEIVEFGVIADACGAVYSTVVHPRLLPTPGPTVHGIPDEELHEGPRSTDAVASPCSSTTPLQSPPLKTSIRLRTTAPPTCVKRDDAGDSHRGSQCAIASLGARSPVGAMRARAM